MNLVWWGNVKYRFWRWSNRMGGPPKELFFPPIFFLHTFGKGIRESNWTLMITWSWRGTWSGNHCGQTLTMLLFLHYIHLNFHLRATSQIKLNEKSYPFCKWRRCSLEKDEKKKIMTDKHTFLYLSFFSCFSTWKPH